MIDKERLTEIRRRVVYGNFTPRHDDVVWLMDELKAILTALDKAKRYTRITGADERTEITLVFQERDFEPLRRIAFDAKTKIGESS